MEIHDVEPIQETEPILDSQKRTPGREREKEDRKEEHREDGSGEARHTADGAETSRGGEGEGRG